MAVIFLSCQARSGYVAEQRRKYLSYRRLILCKEKGLRAKNVKRSQECDELNT
jgi:hypothetical protein